MKPKVDRYWINQPSKLQPHHDMHGVNVLAYHEYDDTYRVYFTSGPVLSMQMFKSALSPGWVGDVVHQAAKTRQTVTHYGRIYAAVASFPDDEEGRQAANAFMEANPQASLLCIQDGQAYLANVDDQGVIPPSIEEPSNQQKSRLWLAQQVQSGEILVWRYENIQSGDVRYDLQEPERGEGALFAIRQATAQDVMGMGDHTIRQLMEEWVDSMNAAPQERPAP